MRPDILVITGPTATGKTALGVLLAGRLGGEVVSADSMQVYRRMDIGTAKPSKAETGGIRHHMIDVAEPWEDYSAARYVREAARAVDEITARGALPIVVGGTGLYIDSLIMGREFSQRGDAALRRELSQRYDALGGAAMLRELRGIDPDTAARLHENDKRRIVRALEVYRVTGRTATKHDEMTRALAPRYRALKLALSFEDRADLYARIDARVDEMLRAGLLEEVRALAGEGVGAGHTAMAAIGYKELLEVVYTGRGEGEAAEKIKLESRRYAKRQLSWLRRDQGVRWIHWGKAPDFAQGLEISTKYLEEYRYNMPV